MTILGISAFYHDSAAAVLKDGKIIAAAQEERFTRKKNDASFPSNAIRFCLEYAGRSVNDLDAVAFYDKPLLKFERLLETYYAFAPRGLTSFLRSMPVWVKEKLFLKKMIRDGLNTIEKVDRKKLKLLFPEHHLSHAASAFYPSPYERAAILTIDGVGEWATASIGLGEGNSIRTLRELDFPHSLGLLYAAFTYYCGFEVNAGEYKLMGLAPYGRNGSAEVGRYKEIILDRLAEIKDDGSVFLRQQYFNYATGLRMANERKWESLFGFPRRHPSGPLDQRYCDLALAIQQLTEEAIIRMAREAKRLTNAEYLCMAGGVALNGVAIGRLDNEKIFKRIFVQPAAGDAGGALGAAYAGHHIYFGQRRTPDPLLPDALMGAYLGNEFSDIDILKVFRKYDASFERIEEEELVERVAALIADRKIIGWHQGRMEFGPRALGARSILADARDPGMQKKLNLAIKFREGFRPFAPVTLAEDAQDYFEHDYSSPYMSFVKQVKKQRCHDLPPGFENKTIAEKLAFPRGDLPAITHVDHSARLQTVHRETNPRLWKLLHAFKQITGHAVMINTSFNVRDEPIVNTPEQAYRCFMKTEMDYLVINNFILDKRRQQTHEKRQP